MQGIKVLKSIDAADLCRGASAAARATTEADTNPERESTTALRARRARYSSLV